MIKRKGNKGETTLYKTLHRKAKYRATQTPLKFCGWMYVLRVGENKNEKQKTKTKQNKQKKIKQTKKQKQKQKQNKTTQNKIKTAQSPKQ